MGVVVAGVVGGAVSVSPSLRVVSADAWLLPQGSGPLAACLASDGVWITLLRPRGVAVLDRAGQVQQYVETAYTPWVVAFDAARSEILVTTTERPGIEVFGSPTRRALRTIPTEQPVAAVTIVADRAFATAFDKAILYALDLPSSKVVATMTLSQPGLQSVFANGKLYVATGVAPLRGETSRVPPSVVDVLGAATGQLLKSIPIPGIHLQAIAWDGDRWVYAASRGGRAKLVRIDVQRDVLDPSFAVDVPRVFDIAVDPVRQVAILSCEGAQSTVCVVSLRDGQLLSQFHGGGQGFMGVERTPEGRILRIWAPDFAEDYIISLDLTRLPWD